MTWTACPYIRKDGQPNPDVRAAILDTVWITQLGESVLTSTLSAAFGRRPSGYAEAAQAIRVWFLDLETGVNPNLVYAQVSETLFYALSTTEVSSSRSFVDRDLIRKAASTTAFWTGGG